MKKRIWLLAAALSAVLSMTACGEAEPESAREVLQASVTEETASDETEEPLEGAPGDDASRPPAGEHADPEELAGQWSAADFSLEDVAAYTDQAYVAVNDNQPYFSEYDLTGQSDEFYSELDGLGRCGTACARVGVDLMPTEKRESISQVKPSGWQNAKYDNVDGKYLYNRCHLIGFQLSGENANEKNLITGTRYLNVDGMLPFENMIADYVKETENHVMYRVTPVFEGDNLVASGVLLEAQSVEDQGEDLQFCVYVYNVQPGITIDYATGASSSGEQSSETASRSRAEEQNPETASQSRTGEQSLESASQLRTEEQNPETASQSRTGEQSPESESQLRTEEQNMESASRPQAEEPQPELEAAQESAPQGTDYILNTSTKKFHDPTCGSVKQMKESNKQVYTGSRDEVIAQGYDPCKKCNP